MKLVNKTKICVALALTLGLTNNGLAGAVGGPKENHDVVRPYHTDVYHISFRSGERASVYVSGDGDTDLDLYIYDEHGNLVASDDDSTDKCLCTWVPKWTGVFRIKVKNRGGTSNLYAIETN